MPVISACRTSAGLRSRELALWWSLPWSVAANLALASVPDASVSDFPLEAFLRSFPKRRSITDTDGPSFRVTCFATAPEASASSVFVSGFFLSPEFLCDLASGPIAPWIPPWSPPANTARASALSGTGLSSADLEAFLGASSFTACFDASILATSPPFAFIPEAWSSTPVSCGPRTRSVLTCPSSGAGESLPEPVFRLCAWLSVRDSFFKAWEPMPASNLTKGLFDAFLSFPARAGLLDVPAPF